MIKPALVAVGLLVSSNQSQTIASMPIDGEMVSEAVTADQYRVPPGLAPKRFAEDLLGAEGLRQWNGSPPSVVSSRPEFTMLAVTAGNGKSVRVLYADASPMVCRTRASLNGSGHAAYRALSWCAAKFGARLPETPPPPVGERAS